jgi:hypothetical protein
MHRLDLRSLGLSIAVALCWASDALAVPRPGDPLPSFQANDLNRKPRTSSELRGRRTFVVVLTAREAGPDVNRWMKAANERYQAGGVRSVVMVSLELPFFVPLWLVQDQARSIAPSNEWERVWLDIRGSTAAALGLRPSPVPYVLALDEDGRVIEVVHALVDAPEAGRIWDALSGGPQPVPVEAETRR